MLKALKAKRHLCSAVPLRSRSHGTQNLPSLVKTLFLETMKGAIYSVISSFYFPRGWNGRSGVTPQCAVLPPVLLGSAGVRWPSLAFQFYLESFPGGTTASLLPRQACGTLGPHTGHPGQSRLPRAPPQPCSQSQQPAQPGSSSARGSMLSGHRASSVPVTMAP